MAKFKKGDRVKIVELGLVHQSLGIAAGSVGTVEEDGSMHPYVTFDGPVGLVAVAETRLEILLPVAEATGKPSLTIETGKFYRTRDGRKVGPMRQYNGGWLYETDDHGRMWRDDGMRYYEESRGGGSDLISEWVDEPASNDNRPATKPAIVALIEKGQPKPSEQPRVHASEYAAIKEAKRLANRHKGQQFGVFVLSKTVSEPIPLYEHEWQNLAANGQKVAAIKELRRITGLGLAATKRAIEHWAEHDEQYSRRAA